MKNFELNIEEKQKFHILGDAFVDFYCGRISFQQLSKEVKTTKFRSKEGKKCYEWYIDELNAIKDGSDECNMTYDFAVDFFKRENYVPKFKIGDVVEYNGKECLITDIAVVKDDTGDYDRFQWNKCYILKNADGSYTDSNSGHYVVCCETTGDNGWFLNVEDKKTGFSMEKFENTDFEFKYCKRDASFRYQLLDRLREDCKYYIGHGMKSKKYLWSLDEKQQIKDMVSLYNSFSEDEKPEWISMDEINEWCNLLLGYGLDKLGVGGIKGESVEATAEKLRKSNPNYNDVIKEVYDFEKTWSVSKGEYPSLEKVIRAYRVGDTTAKEVVKRLSKSNGTEEISAGEVRISPNTIFVGEGENLGMGYKLVFKHNGKIVEIPYIYLMQKVSLNGMETSMDAKTFVEMNPDFDLKELAKDVDKYIESNFSMFFFEKKPSQTNASKKRKLTFWF